MPAKNFCIRRCCLTLKLECKGLNAFYWLVQKHSTLELINNLVNGWCHFGWTVGKRSAWRKERMQGSSKSPPQSPRVLGEQWPNNPCFGNQKILVSRIKCAHWFKFRNGFWTCVEKVSAEIDAGWFLPKVFVSWWLERFASLGKEIGVSKTTRPCSRTSLTNTYTILVHCNKWWYETLLSDGSISPGY